MGVTYRHGISILQLIIYLPSFFMASCLVFRHGFRQNSGFFFLVLFTLTRIVGACCDLATIHNSSTGIFIAAAICSSIGLSPLILTCSGLLSRANLSIQNTTGQPALHTLSFHFFRLMTILCMVLSIVGITSDMSPEGLSHPDIKVKVGAILYIVIWALMCLYLAVLIWRRYALEKGERRILVAVAISAPFILVRVIYSLLIWFAHDSAFSLFNGSVTVQLVMSVLEEFAVVIVCLGVGMTLRMRSKTPAQDVKASSAYPPASYANA